MLQMTISPVNKEFGILILNTTGPTSPPNQEKKRTKNANYSRSRRECWGIWQLWENVMDANKDKEYVKCVKFSARKSGLVNFLTNLKSA